MSPPDRDWIDAQFDLTDRVAIVTGGSRGIGRAVAQGYAAAGATVVISSRTADDCEATASEINGSGGKAISVPTHVGKLEDLDRLVETTVDSCGRIDIVVNNAANPLMMGVGDLTPEAWDKSFNTNLRGPVFLTQAALPQLRESENASVINVLSGAAYGFAPHHLLYSVTKAGLAAATRSMAATLASDGIRVNSIVPGTTDTDMVRAMPEEFQARAASASILRRAADPSELIGLALLLAADAGGYMTGQTYFCDGGMVPR